MGVIIRQSIKGTIVTYIGSFIGFLTTMFIVTKYLTQEELGLTKILFDAAFLLSGLSILGLQSSIVRFFPHFRNENNHNNGFFFYIVTIPLIGILLFFSLFFILKQPISSYFAQNSGLFVKYYNYVILLSLFLIYWNIFESYGSVFKRIVVPRLVREVIVRLLLIVIYLLYAFRIINIDGFVACYVAVYGIAMLIVFFYVSRIGTISLKHDFSFIEKPLKREYLSYTMFVLLGSFGSTIISKIDVFMISANIGLSSTGIYTIALFMAAVIEIPSRSITAISSPIASELIKSNKMDEVDNLYKKVSLHQFLVGSMIFVLIWINIDSIYSIIPNGDSYSAGKWALFFLATSNLTWMTFLFGTYLIQFSKYYRWSSYFVIFLSLLTVYTNYLLIPVLGITGASIATLITTIISYGLQQVFIYKKMKVSPFSRSLTKTIVVLLIILFVNYFLPKLPNPWIDGIYRSFLIMPLSFGLVYFWKISEEVNHLTNLLINKIKKK